MMPGRIDPVGPVIVRQTALAVHGNDAAVALHAAQGLLENNRFEALMPGRLDESMRLMSTGYRLFAERCVTGVGVDAGRCLRHLEASPAIASAFPGTPGYATVTALAKQARAEGRSFLEPAREQGLPGAEHQQDALAAAAGITR